MEGAVLVTAYVNGCKNDGIQKMRLLPKNDKGDYM